MKSDARIVTRTGERKKATFNARDMATMAQFIMDEFGKRKRLRMDKDLHWDEIDRQIAMIPEKGDRQSDDPHAWMPEMELPNQAQALEVLTADARRMMLPDTGSFFAAHAALTDEYLDRVDFQSLVAGDETEVPSQINQDNADKLVQGIHNYWHRQYDFGKHIDLINADVFKYGTGVGRVRVVEKPLLINDAKGTGKTKFPCLIPRPIKNTYLDESTSVMLHEGFFVGPAVIFEQKIKHKDLVLAATRGSQDPNSMEGGWIPKALKNVKEDANHEVALVEYEGDLIVPRQTTESLFLPGAIVTVLSWGSEGEAGESVIRLRFRKHLFSTYIEFPYHYEDMESAYGTSPLLKGRPIQRAATDALNRTIAAAALDVEPPTGYDVDDMALAASGGPKIYPGASWASLGEIKVHQIGNPAAMFAIYAGLLQQYDGVTGMNAARLGDQTVSHTTAFAKDAELQRGQVRTVDYVRNTLKGPMNQCLHMEYVLGRESMKKERFFIDEYGGFVDIEKKHLADDVTYEVHGSGGPQEEQDKMNRKLQSLQLALQMDQVGVQMGRQPEIDTGAAIAQVLREGGWTDIDFITGSQIAASGAPGGAPVGDGGQLSGIVSAAPEGVA